MELLVQYTRLSDAGFLSSTVHRPLFGMWYRIHENRYVVGSRLGVHTRGPWFGL